MVKLILGTDMSLHFINQNNLD